MTPSNNIILTAIYKEFWGTEEFRKSLSRFDLEVHNVFPPKTPYMGNGFIYQYFYKALQELKGSYETVVYSDGADTFFQKPIIPPNDKIIYSVEKAIWPPLPKLKALYENYYNHPRHKGIKHLPWKYLNGGNWSGPIDLLIEFYERYGLTTLTGDINGQLEQAEAFMRADFDGFPIEFDHKCEYFQTIAFEHEGDFSLAEDGKSLVNNLTGTIPCILHGNGRTEMKSIYDRWKT